MLPTRSQTRSLSKQAPRTTATLPLSWIFCVFFFYRPTCTAPVLPRDLTVERGTTNLLAPARPSSSQTFPKRGLNQEYEYSSLFVNQL